VDGINATQPPQTVTYLSTNHAWRKLSLLIKTSALPLYKTTIIMNRCSGKHYIFIENLTFTYFLAVKEW